MVIWDLMILCFILSVWFVDIGELNPRYLVERWTIWDKCMIEFYKIK